MRMSSLDSLGLVGLAASSCLLAILLSGCGGTPTSPSAGGSTTPVTTPLAIVSVTPKDVPVGSSAVTIVVTGTGFTSSTRIQLSGAAVETTFISSTELRATIPASQMQAGA